MDPEPDSIAFDARLVTDFKDFLALSPAWNSLVAERRDSRVFLSHEWFESAWCWRQRTAQPWLLCFFQEDRLHGVLPLVLENDRRAGLSVRTLSFLTVPDTQACDVIASRGHESCMCEAMARELARRRREWDVLHLGYLVPNSLSGSLLRGAVRREGLATQLNVAEAAPFVSLTTSWNAYSETRSRPLERAEMVDAKRLKKAGSVQVDWLAPGTGGSADRAEFLDRAIAVSASSWKARTRNTLDNPGPESFIRRLTFLAHERGWLSIWLLTVNNRPVAMEYHLVANSHVYGIRADYDEAFRKISPGTYLRRYALERYFALGLDRYYMGPGLNAHKSRWAKQAEPLEEISIYGKSLMAQWLATWETVVKPVAKKLTQGNEMTSERAREGVADDSIRPRDHPSRRGVVDDWFSWQTSKRSSRTIRRFARWTSR